MSFVEDFPLAELKILRDVVTGKDVPAASAALAAITVVSYITGLVFKAIVVKDVLCRLPKQRSSDSQEKLVERISDAIDSAISAKDMGIVEHDTTVPWNEIFHYAMATVNNVAAPTP